MSKSLQKASNCNRRVEVYVEGCRELAEALEISHLVLSAIYLLSYGVRSNRCAKIYFKLDNKIYTVEAHGKPRMLHADYYTGMGLLKKTLRKSLSSWLKVHIVSEPPTPCTSIEDYLKTILITISTIDSRVDRPPCIAIPCDASYAYIFAVYSILADRVSA